MADWRRHGLLAFTINLQGGSPEGYVKDQPWHNSAFAPDGALRADYLERLERILDRADELGMVVILGIFYFGQDEYLQDEAAVIRATDATIHWLFARNYRHVLIEINNECNVRYDHAILRPDRVDELIARVKGTSREGRRFSDFLLIHGNGVTQPGRIAEMVRQTRAVPGYAPKPVLFNEDDHYGFDQPTCNFTAAIGEYASWGLYDQGKNDYEDGFQSPPVNWGLNTVRKRAFFRLVAAITGSEDPDTRSAGAPAPGYSE
jgi:hypothetical protein